MDLISHSGYRCWQIGTAQKGTGRAAGKPDNGYEVSTTKKLQVVLRADTGNNSLGTRRG